MRKAIWKLLLVAGVGITVVSPLPSSAWAQPKHYLFSARQPTGEIGRAQLRLRPELQGYFQPVRINAPRGATIEIAEAGGFRVADIGMALVGLQVGHVYRLKISQIPNRGLASVYPTIELLDRMHPPAGKETRFPIPIEITSDDLALALSGKYVTRVVYVEDPRTAVAARELPEQRYFEVLPNEEPLAVASELGRPVAILRMGSLTPGIVGPTDEFLFGSPPLQRHAPVFAADYVPSELDADDLPVSPRTKKQSPDVLDPDETAEEARFTEPAEDQRDVETTPERDVFDVDVPTDQPDTDDAESNPFEDI